VTSVPRFYGDRGFVDEHWEGASFTRRGPAAPALVCGLDTNEAACAAFVFELNDAGDLCEQSVVFADADINARLEFRTALSNQDRTSSDELSSESLYPQPLRMAIATVA
jgi:hypothetical protein